MSWIGLRDHATRRFNQAGLAHGSGARTGTDAPHGPADLLSRGALMLETGIPAHDRPQTLLSYHHLHPWERGLSLQALPDGSVVLVVTQGGTVSHTPLHHGLTGEGYRLRITYIWDAPARQGWLSVRALGASLYHLQPVATPVPLSLRDLQTLFTQPASEIDAEVAYLALSDTPVPVGPMPSIAPDTPILTAQGYRPISELKRGDLIRTPDGDQVPVLANIACTVPAKGGFRPVRLRAPYFGLQRDITVAPDQRLCVSGADVEFLFGAPSALVPVQHLVNGVSAFYTDETALVTWHQLLLPRNQPILAAGAALHSLYLGRMRRKVDQISVSLLAAYERSRLPEHARPVFPVLKPFEAATFVQHRAV
ncbi:MAG: Hint domain-containing protein [Thalassovita sp.]